MNSQSTAPKSFNSDLQSEVLSPMDIRKKVALLESNIRKMPEAMIGDCFPLVHKFAKGLYIRQITVPAGALVVTKIHKFSHAVFLLQGEISVLEEHGSRKVKAPASFITPAGTKRVVYHHTETVLTTVHATEETDLEKIENEIIAKDFDEIESNVIDIENFVEEVTKEEVRK